MTGLSPLTEMVGYLIDIAFLDDADERLHRDSNKTKSRVMIVASRQLRNQSFSPARPAHAAAESSFV